MPKKNISTEDKLSSTLEDYIEIIFTEEYLEGAARTGSIAEKAKVSASTVTSALKTLEKLGYVTYHPYKFIHLTEKGKKLGSKIVHRHSVLLEFFGNILDMETEKADDIACKVEHVLDNETFDKLRKFVYFTTKEPLFLEKWKTEGVNMTAHKKTALSKD